MVKTTVKIEGMKCSHCEAHMVEAIENAFDVRKADASHEKAQAEVISAEPLDGEKLRKIVEETGFTYISHESAPYEKKGFSIFKK